MSWKRNAVTITVHDKKPVITVDFHQQIGAGNTTSAKYFTETFTDREKALSRVTELLDE